MISVLADNLRLIGERLYAIRKKRGLTQVEVAEAAGLSERTYPEIERGIVNMRILTFIRICDAETNQELCRYNLSENYDHLTALVFGELYLYNGGWKFNAIGQPTQDNSVGDLAKRFI